LKAFVRFVMDHYEGELKRMFKEPVEDLRPRLLSIKGIGPETADSILLYAGGMPIFVVDAYTKRVLGRHRLITSKTSYNEMQQLFMDHPRSGVEVYNEFHALLVRVGKEHCKTKPVCGGCPLEIFLKGKRPKIW